MPFEGFFPPYFLMFSFEVDKLVRSEGLKSLKRSWVDSVSITKMPKRGVFSIMSREIF